MSLTDKQKLAISAAVRHVLEAVQIVFLCLKLTGTVAWSWWVVLVPLWGAVVIAFVAVVAICWLSKRMTQIYDL